MVIDGEQMPDTLFNMVKTPWKVRICMCSCANPTLTETKTSPQATPRCMEPGMTCRNGDATTDLL